MGNRILTGLRANGELHLGNYLGAMLPMVNLQNGLKADDKLFMFVPDLHSFTTPVDHSQLYKNSLKNMQMFIAAGVDPTNQQTVLYRQSQVPAHSEMTWLLNCFTYYGEASRMTEFKDKSEQLGGKAVSVGLFDYPVLMAADILLYHANYVPVGDDQRQHLELTRDIAERINAKFGEVLTVPSAWKDQLEFASRDSGLRVRSLSHPEQKMSKSVDNPSGTIALTENSSKAAKKIKSAQTDNLGQINYDFANQPGVSNLLQILAAFNGAPLELVTAEWQGKEKYGDLKAAVADTVVKFLIKFQKNLENVSLGDVEKYLETGETQAREISTKTLLDLQKKLGLRR